MLASPFFQNAPKLGNQWLDDSILRAYCVATWPKDIQEVVEPELCRLGADAGARLYELQLADRLNEPSLTPYDPWGRRLDHIEVTPLWKEAQKLAVEYRLVAQAYERRWGDWTRPVQAAFIHLFDGSTDVYTCPLAMTDGAAKTLSVSANKDLKARALPHLLSHDPATAWTSGQWMTERTGGSDVGLTQTYARISQENGAERHRLYGTKWFTSATTSQMALTLARPEGNKPGGRGLALYYIERSLADGTSNGITVNRLKDKLGTRKVPTAELTLDGTIGVPVDGITDGIRHIAPMLNITRTWNAVCSVSVMRRGLALAEAFAKERFAFSALLKDKPLHHHTLFGLHAEYAAMLALVMRTARALSVEEGGGDATLLRILTPLAKLTTGKAAVRVTSEVCEAFGGAGYIEDTGVPRLLRDAQVLPIWEGTTNVLSLDVYKCLQTGETREALTELVTKGSERHPDRDFLRAQLARALTVALGPDGERLARHVALALGRVVAACELHPLALAVPATLMPCLQRFMTDWRDPSGLGSE